MKDFLRPVAEVTYADAHKQRIGEGVVEFRTRDDMERAIRKLDGTELNGRKISLIEDSSSGLKLLPEMPEAIFIDEAIAQVAQLGRINQAGNPV